MLSTGCNVKDIGLCLSPTVYLSQFKLNSDAVAMITASHNENGWTGIKMGIEKGLTHCKDEMSELKNIVLNKKFTKGKGSEKASQLCYASRQLNMWKDTRSRVGQTVAGQPIGQIIAKGKRTSQGRR